jgi:hypothetical protein
MTIPLVNANLWVAIDEWVPPVRKISSSAQGIAFQNGAKSLAVVAGPAGAACLLHGFRTLRQFATRMLSDPCQPWSKSCSWTRWTRMCSVNDLLRRVKRPHRAC